MSRKCSTALMASVCMVAISGWAAGMTDAAAQSGHSGHQHGAHAGHDHGQSSPIAPRPPHGGQMTVAGPLSFEVVYRPRETRVYLYRSKHQPIAARGVRGQLVMKMHGNDKQYPFPLKHVALKPGSTRQDYLAAAVDVSRIRDGSMKVTFELAGLPNAQEPRATFTQTFALSKIPVTVAMLDESDRARIERQKVCAVSGGKLGSMGTPVKVLVGDQPIYLCCRGCLGKVQANPDAYLQKVAPAGSQAQAGASSGRIVVASATAADQAAISQQRVCAVTGGKLGSMGAPVKVAAGGQSLFLCCKGCLGKVEKNPDAYFAKAAELRAAR